MSDSELRAEWGRRILPGRATAGNPRTPSESADLSGVEGAEPLVSFADAVAEDTLRTVLAGEVRGGWTGHIGGVEGAFRRTPDGVYRLGSGLPHLLKLEHHRSRNAYPRTAKSFQGGFPLSCGGRLPNLGDRQFHVRRIRSSTRGGMDGGLQDDSHQSSRC